MEPVTLKVVITALFFLSIGFNLAFVDRPQPEYGIGTWLIASCLQVLLLYFIWTVF